MTVVSASVATWADPDIALHSLTVVSTTAGAPRWDALGERLRLLAPFPAAFPLHTDRPGDSDRGHSGPRRSVVKVTGPDGLGFLEAISRWFAEHGVSIEAAEITTHDGTATDRFLVNGAVRTDRALEPPEPATGMSVAPSPGTAPSPAPLAGAEGGRANRPVRRSRAAAFRGSRSPAQVRSWRWSSYAGWTPPSCTWRRRPTTSMWRGRWSWTPAKRHVPRRLAAWAH